MTARIRSLIEKSKAPKRPKLKPAPQRKKLTLHNAQTPEEIRHVVEYQELLAQQWKQKDRERKRKQ